MNIVIVESPAKAKTINKYLGASYEVLASFGHVRDLPAKNGSVDPEANFQMIWEVDPKAAGRLNDIAKALKGADKLILATDPDREGEAISWHVLEVLKEKRAIKDHKIERVVFNAITKQAVTEAMKNPRQIDGALVDAYMARRALDYLVGFTLSPVLWRKLPGARSAGRVQSVALRLVCDRELEIEKFIPREYWSLVATLTTPRGEAFEARLIGADGKKIQRLDIGTGAEAEELKKAIEAANFTVSTVEAKPARRNPQAPFTTSTLQQEASRKMGFAPAHTMRIAQRLYEGIDIGGETTGLITYMRTDGVQIDGSAITQARKVIGEDYGNAYVPDAPRQYQTKAKNAQEAHEAIRPTDLSRRPAEMRRRLDTDQARLYELIWTRTIASQMESAEMERTTVDIAAKAGSRVLELRATGQVIKFDGFLALYQEGRDDDGDDEDSRRLPAMSEGEALKRQDLAVTQHFTEPPPRFSEASLVKRMEELGIGRPSTYASILQVLKDRGYVRLEKKRLHGEDKGRVVVAFLENFFAKYVEYDFTAELEEQLDRISNNEISWQQVLKDFWVGFIGAVNEIKDLRVTQVLDALDDMLGPHIYRAARRRRRSPAMPDLRHRQAQPQGRKIRRLRRLHQLSGMPLHPPARRRQRGQRRPHPRQGSGDRSRRRGEGRPVRSLHPARRAKGLCGRRKAEARRHSEKHVAVRHRTRSGAKTAVAAARNRQASGDRRADHRGARPFRSIRAPREDLCQPRGRRRGVRHRSQPRGDADRGEDFEGPERPPLRRRSRQAAGRSPHPRRRRGQERTLRRLCHGGRRQRHHPERQDPGNHHAGRSHRPDRRTRRQGRRQAEARRQEESPGEKSRGQACQGRRGCGAEAGQEGGGEEIRGQAEIGQRCRCQQGARAGDGERQNLARQAGAKPSARRAPARPAGKWRSNATGLFQRGMPSSPSSARIRAKSAPARSRANSD